MKTITSLAPLTFRPQTRRPGLHGPLLLTLLLTADLPVPLQAGCDGFGSTSSGGCGGGSNPSGVIVIPSFMNGEPVTRIVTSAFQGNTAITGLVIPDTVTNIGDRAFSGCSGLTNVTMGNGITQIGPSAFSGCYNLTFLAVPNSVTNIGDGAFSYCYGLTNVTLGTNINHLGNRAFLNCNLLPSVTLPQSLASMGETPFGNCANLMTIAVEPFNPNFSSLSGVMFNKDRTTLLQYPGGKSGAYSVPSGVTNIGAGAFASCSQLTRIVLPPSLTSIGDGAFTYCGLTNVVIPSGVTNIGFLAFNGCQSLNAINVAALNSAYASAGGVLFNHSETTLIQCPAAKTGSYSIPDTVTQIEPSAFNSCFALTQVTIAPGVTTIGDQAFIGCNSLTSIFIPDSVTQLGDNVFASCDSLMIVTIGNNVTRIGTGTFAYCGSLFSVAIGNSVRSIGDNAFVACTGLGNVTIPNSVTNIGEGAFSDCQNLWTVTVGDGVASIGNSAFYGCYRLANVFCRGNAPSLGGLEVFNFDFAFPTIHYLPGTTGWGSSFGGYPTVPWQLPNPLILSHNSRFGVRTNQFRFTISWATNVPVVVEACTNLTSPVWTPVATNTLTAGSFSFGDPEWSKYPGRFYRIRSQ
jgi:hypothetical protein